MQSLRWFEQALQQEEHTNSRTQHNTKVWYATALEQAGQVDRAKAVS